MSNKISHKETEKFPIFLELKDKIILVLKPDGEEIIFTKEDFRYVTSGVSSCVYSLTVNPPIHKRIELFDHHSEFYVGVKRRCIDSRVYIYTLVVSDEKGKKEKLIIDIANGYSEKEIIFLKNAVSFLEFLGVSFTDEELQSAA